MKMHWKDFEKSAQPVQYAGTGGVAGAVSGAALAAILSALHYRNKKKQSLASRILKGLGWAALGAAGGGAAGYGIGRVLGSHMEYKKTLDEAKKITDLAEKNGIKPRNGRVLYVTFPKEMMVVGDKELEKGMPSWVSNEQREKLKKVFPGGINIQHAGILTMDDDGGNARFFEVADSTGEQSKARFNNKISLGKKTNNEDYVRGGEYGLDNGLTYGLMNESYFGDKLKGKSLKEIAKLLQIYGRDAMGGDDVNIYEGRKNVNLNLVHNFIQEHNKRINGYGGTGYNIIPGGYNCGTAARAAFDSVQSPWSHLLDMLWGGRPEDNAPSLASKTHYSSGGKSVGSFEPIRDGWIDVNDRIF